MVEYGLFNEGQDEMSRFEIWLDIPLPMFQSPNFELLSKVG